MDSAHLHLILNHFPILGILFGALFLFVALWKKNDFMIVFSQIFFILIVLITIPAYWTGDDAGEIIKQLPGVNENLIDAHEDLGFIGFLLSIILGLLSFVNLIFLKKSKEIFTKFSYGILIFSIVVFGFMIYVGQTGGLIHHQELRGQTEQIQNIDNIDKNKHDKDRD